jgi:hypothetical protein
MPDCKHREKLCVEYDDAVVLFSASVTLLRHCHGDSFHDFAEQYKVTELARLDTEDVRLRLELHRKEHGC